MFKLKRPVREPTWHCSQAFMERNTLAPKDVPVLIPGLCCYVTVQGTRDFAGVNEIKGLEMRRLPWIMQMSPIKSQGWKRGTEE